MQCATGDVPVVDLSGGVTPAFVAQFGKGLQDFGFVSVVGHGVDSDLLNNVYETGRQVFDLPEAVKKQYETPENGRQTGYTPFGIEHAEDRPKEPDLKEFWHAYRPGHETVNLFPKEVPEFERFCLDLYAVLDTLGQTLLGAVGSYLGRPPGFFEEWARGGNNLLRILNYPEIPKGSVGMRSAPHGDINLITLLPAATDAGLEIQTRDGRWLAVNNPPDAIIVNNADMMELHTSHYPGTRLASTKHRVVNQSGRRLSIPYFVHPRSDVPIVTAGDFLRQRIQNIGLFGP